MKRLVAFGILLVCGFMMHAASGQTEKQEAPPPKTPLLPRAPEFSSWTIIESIGKQKDAPGPAGSVGDIRCTVTKTGATYREVSTDPERGEATKWVVNGFQIKQDPREQRLIRIPRTKYSSELSDYLRSDFELFEWISRESYKGVQNYEGRPCYVFEVESSKKRLTPRERYDKSLDEPEAEKASGAPSTGIEPGHILTAYLDVATQLPVALKKGDTLWTYTFNPPPTGPLSLPADVQENLARWQNAIQARNRPPPRP